MACRNSLVGGGRVGLDGHEQWRSVGVVCSLSRGPWSASSLLLPNEDTHASRQAARVLVLGPPCLWAAQLPPRSRHLWTQHVIVKAYTHHTLSFAGWSRAVCERRTAILSRQHHTGSCLSLPMLEAELPCSMHSIMSSHSHARI